jgi:ornithine cyclodeaminase
MPDLIAAMEDALIRFSAGDVTQPVRTVLEVGTDGAFFGVMPAALADPPALGAKLVTVFHRNLQRGLPSHLATILLLDPDTGALQAILDGRYITEARTAAVSAVSVKHLARPDAAVLAIIGSGVQARSHLEAIRRVRSLSDVRVWSPDVLHREAFAFEMGEATGLRVRATASASAAVDGADVVVLATSSRVAVIDDRDVVWGAHVVAVGACRPDQREMPASLVARARVFVDSREAASHEAGDLVLARSEGAIADDHVAGELGEVAAGRVVGRDRADTVTIFKSLGLAVEDLAAARLALTRAVAAGLGRSISLS